MTALLDPTTAGAPEPDPRPSTLSDRVRGQLATPLVRAGLSLVASAGITSLLGLLYWSLAARRYSPAAIGATAALLAAMEIVAAVANLGLRTALIRFVPALGDRAARVVAVSYGVAGLTALARGGGVRRRPRAMVRRVGPPGPHRRCHLLPAVVRAVGHLQPPGQRPHRPAPGHVGADRERAVRAGQAGAARRTHRVAAPLGGLRLLDGPARPHGPGGQHPRLPDAAPAPAGPRRGPDDPRPPPVLRW